MIEFDVRRARDGRLVISHDPIGQLSSELPTLEETLQLTQGRIQLDVELKEPGCERDAIDLLLRYFPLTIFASHRSWRLCCAKLAPSMRAFEPA